MYQQVVLRRAQQGLSMQSARCVRPSSAARLQLSSAQLLGQLTWHGARLVRYTQAGTGTAWLTFWCQQPPRPRGNTTGATVRKNRTLGAYRAVPDRYMGCRVNHRSPTEGSLFCAAEAKLLKRTRHTTLAATSPGRLHRRFRRLEMSASPAGHWSSFEARRSRVTLRNTLCALGTPCVCAPARQCWHTNT